MSHRVIDSSAGGSILGRSVLRVEDPRMLVGSASFLENLSFDGAVEALFVRSSHAAATIRSIDTSAARALPGVVDVIVGSDVPFPAMPSPLPFVNRQMLRPLLAQDVVRFVGEPVAVVLAGDRSIAADAADLVVVDYQVMSAVVDPDRALEDSTLVHPAAGTNVAAGAPQPDVDAMFAGCDVVVEQRLVNQRIAAAPMENRVGVAAWQGEHLTVWSCTQMPHVVKGLMCALYQRQPDQVRVINTDMGGGFGAKLGMGVEELLLPWLAQTRGSPVRWVETRSENMMSMPHAHAQVQHVRIGGTRNGRVAAYALHVLMDTGAYPTMGPVLPMLTGMVSQGTYDIPNVAYTSSTVVTNTTPVAGFHGAGRPEGIAAIERAIDLFADQIGLDPAEVRRRNLISKDQFPYATQVGVVYDVGDYERALDMLLTAADYQELLAEQERRRAGGDTALLGVGLSSYVEISNPMKDSEYGSIEVHRDGTATLTTGSSAHGQGHETTFAQVASSITGIAIASITLAARDTDVVPRGGGTGGSKSMQLGGSAIAGASDALVLRARDLVANRLEADVTDVVLDTSRGVFHVAGAPARSVSWADLAGDGELRAESDFKAEQSSFPFGAHLVVVEVDAETGSCASCASSPSTTLARSSTR